MFEKLFQIKLKAIDSELIHPFIPLDKKCLDELTKQRTLRLRHFHSFGNFFIQFYFEKMC